MLMILLPCLAQCLSMGEAVLHFITSIEKDGNSSSTLSFSKCLYIYVFYQRCNLCISLPIITWLLGVQPSFVFVLNKCRITITLSSPHWYILAMPYAYGKMMKVAPLFYLRYVVYDLTICSQLNGIKMIKIPALLFVEVKWLNSKPTYSMLLFDLSLPCVV